MKQSFRKRIIVSVTNDLVSDNRVHKVCTTLTEMGFQVQLVGRLLPWSTHPGVRPYRVCRFRLLFRKGPLFYASYNIRLFFFLLFSRFDVLLSNDLDSLPANFIAARFKKKPLVYDSHEYFTEVPELIGRPLVKKVWEWMEMRMVPHVQAAITVNDSIAGIYTQKFNIPFRVVRNLPTRTEKVKPRENGGSRIILYQGSLNPGRGLEQIIRAMKYLDGARLVIAGEGEKRAELMRLAEKEGVEDKVEFTGRLSIARLAELTPQASVGLSVEEDLGLNYHYALPNKLFDYIQARVPVLVSALPEMEAVVRKYRVGEVIPESTPEILARKLLEMLTDGKKREIWQKNLELAARELVWEKEEKILHKIFREYL